MIKRKNPKENITDQLLDHLAAALIYGDESQFSKALVYYSVGEKCKDCDKIYTSCTCEGSREFQDYKCEYCNENYCVCEYIKFGSSFKEIRKVIYEFIKKNIGKNDQKTLKWMIISMVKTYLKETISQKDTKNWTTLLKRLDEIYK